MKADYTQKQPRSFVLLAAMLAVTMTLIGLATAAFAPSAFAQSPCGDTEVVVEGDTLNEIAARCGVSVEALLAANPGVADVTELEIGRVLAIPPTEDPDAPITYVVQSGDWLSIIAQNYNTTVEAIVAANPAIVNPNVLIVGQTILIPLSGGELAPSVVIQPEAGLPGSQVQVTISGYPTTTVLLVGLGEPETEPTISQTVTTDIQGAATTTFNVPADAQANQRYTVIAYVPVVDGARDTSAEFIVVGNDDPPAPTPATEPALPSSVAISPTSGPPGTMVDLNAAGLPANTIFDIGAGPLEAEYNILALAETDDDGMLIRSVRIPDLAEPGEQWVVALTPAESSGDILSNPFTVTEPATEGSETAIYTSTNIYLIALEDNGRTGMQIGCGDSVVPVEIEIEPTVGIIRSALQELLSLDSRMYNGFGLYNALYRSDLSIEEMSLTDGAASVSLVGDVSLGGVCDGPRFKAQLRQTVLQFFNVDEVTILINRELLDDVVP
ncbi:LysM peptidoglycan-binding domain-containing protein [bacterium]|nr:LysM peptidoglycan-binding domain-containing protein [bacterium]